jgi:hypothetical protein
MSKLTGICPDCDSTVAFKRPPNMGQVVVCRECRQSLIVVNRKPLELDVTDSDEDYSQVDESRQKKGNIRRGNSEKELAW